MNVKEALIALRKLEGADEIYDVVESEITRLSSSRRRSTDLTQAVNDLGDDLGASGSPADILEFVRQKLKENKVESKKTQSQVVDLTAKLEKEQQKVTAAEAKYSDLKATLQAQKKETVINQVATIAKANPQVLSLVSKDVDFKIEDGKAMVKPSGQENGSWTEVRKFAETNEMWKPLLRSLFPDDQQSGSEVSGSPPLVPASSPVAPPPKLPTGGSGHADSGKSLNQQVLDQILKGFGDHAIATK
ncbi:MAG: hypothetical protein F6K55_03395 [Moorea sp. SIO4A3]|nr:hypothetical protein [Moorena sp. SIO4A3]